MEEKGSTNPEACFGVKTLSSGVWDDGEGSFIITGANGEPSALSWQVCRSVAVLASVCVRVADRGGAFCDVCGTL